MSAKELSSSWRSKFPSVENHEPLLINKFRPIASPIKSRATGDKAKKKRVSLGKGLTTAAGKQRDQASPVKGDGSRSSPIRLMESDEESAAAKQAAFEGELHKLSVNPLTVV